MFWLVDRYSIFSCLFLIIGPAGLVWVLDPRHWIHRVWCVVKSFTRRGTRMLYFYTSCVRSSASRRPLGSVDGEADALFWVPWLSQSLGHASWFFLNSGGSSRIVVLPSSSLLSSPKYPMNPISCESFCRIPFPPIFAFPGGRSARPPPHPYSSISLVNILAHVVDISWLNLLILHLLTSFCTFLPFFRFLIFCI